MRMLKGIFSVLFIVVLCAAWPDPARNGRDILCNRVWPSEGGRFKHEPPFWEFNNCPIQMFSRENVTNCMKGRTLYVVGNSIARQIAFNMLELLGGVEVSREDQKNMCPKNRRSWDGCRQEFAGVKIKYLYLQFMDGFYYVGSRGGFPFYRYRQTDANPGRTPSLRTGRMANASASLWVSSEESPALKGKYWLDDNCLKRETRSCLRDFFRDASPDDLLVFTMGHAYPLPSDEEDEEAKKKVLETGEVGVDVGAWLLSSATAFRGHLAATFPGTVFNVMMAQTNPYRYLAYQSPMLYRTNTLLFSLWQLSNEARPWFFVDQWAINENKYHLYNDHIHFNGNLSHATLYQILNEFCPGGGDDKLTSSSPWPAPSLFRHIVLDRDEREYYIVNGDDTRIHLELTPEKTLPVYFSSLEVVERAHRDVELLAPVSLLCPYLADRTVFLGADRTVYLLDKKAKRAFPSAEVLFKHGFSFGQVRRVDGQCVDLIPQGMEMA